MPRSLPVLSAKTVLAIAVISSLSACSSVPRTGGVSIEGMRDGLASAGKATADTTVRIWDRAAWLLGFSDEEPGVDQELDEVDVALMEEDAPPPGNADATALGTSEGVVIRPATTAKVDELAPLELDDSSASNNTNVAQSADLEELPAVDSATTPSASSDVLADYTHEVNSSETLWEIAKATTGDANNWHVLADVNDLAPNAGVYPGQELIIPSDMVKPELIGAVAANTDTDKLDAEEELDTHLLADGSSNPNSKAAPGTDRLAIPTADVADATQTVQATHNPSQRATAFTLAEGETLWEFSKRTTGDATNWQAIAGQNGFTEQQALVVYSGQEIFVPEGMVKDAQTPSVAAAEPTDDKAATDALIAEATNKTPTEAVSRQLSNGMDETQEMKIVEATFKSDDTALTDGDIASEAGQALAETGAPPQEIMVSGTYYPKAVYNTADFSSSLLMRVSPGTRLKVSRAMGSWYEVQTENGTGFVHARDIK